MGEILPRKIISHNRFKLSHAIENLSNGIFTPYQIFAGFDAVMKHHSFTQAAQDLHVTQGAVGQQIRKLEDWLGVLLFVRGVRQLHPTAEASAYWAGIKPALARIQQASDQLRLSHANEVWLSMPPTLAAKWFAPRMEGFLAKCPGISASECRYGND